jgi:thioredoxin-dependent peroxiredoxin
MAEPLRAGERAPEFRAMTDDGKEIALKDFHGKNVILYFFPKALTPG